MAGLLPGHRQPDSGGLPDHVLVLQSSIVEGNAGHHHPANIVRDFHRPHRLPYLVRSCFLLFTQVFNSIFLHYTFN